MPVRVGKTYIAPMNLTFDMARFQEQINQFNPSEFAEERALALLAAAIATGESSPITQTAKIATRHGLSDQAIYEIVLQSYLFLGFPRMLIAADLIGLGDRIPAESLTPATISEQSPDWLQRGDRLYRQVYQENHERLKSRVQAFAPEIFDWMILEGYGKVLSRDTLKPDVRELAIVSTLMVENRPKQLHSHMKGALNVGALRQTIELVVEDVGSACGDGYTAAREILEQI